MRISIVQGPFLPVPPLLGGAVEKVWFSLGKEFARRGHTVTHVSRAFPGLPVREAIEGVSHSRVSGFASPATFSRRIVLDFWYAARALRHIPHGDIVVTNTFWLPVLLRGRRRGIPYVHVARYPKGQMKLYRRAALQTVSEPIRQAILAEDPSAGARLRVIPYPLANKYLSPAVPPGSNVILYTGRVHPEKGLHLLIDAFARLGPRAADWKLEIVGPWEVEYGGGGEDYLARLKAAAAPVQARAEFVGRIFDEQKLIARYTQAKVFVYPSLAEKGETFGLAALEAMAAGGAPIVSALECFQDFIRPGANGLIFNHRLDDPADGLAATLASLLADPALLERMRQAAWTTAREYTMDRVVNLFLNDFGTLLGAPQTGTPAVAPARP